MDFFLEIATNELINMPRIVVCNLLSISALQNATLTLRTKNTAISELAELF